MNELNQRSILDLESELVTAENELDRIKCVYPDSYTATVIGQRIDALAAEIAARGEVG
jgi:hypothetical protein